MLTFFRRAFKSWVVIGLLALIAIAVVVTGVGTPNGLSGGSGDTGTGERIARLGGSSVTASDLIDTTRRQLQLAQQRSPELDMPAFVAGPTLDRIADQLIASKALEAWGREHGFLASDRMVDGDIAAVPAFRGPTGRFDEATFRQVLARQRMAEPAVRREFGGDAIRRQLVAAISGGAGASAGYVVPYASLLLEKREGLVGIVPTELVPPGPAPTEAEIATWYRQHLGAYSLPERRMFRYALVSPQQVRAAAPSEAEIAAFYKANAASYAASQTRTLSQVILPTEAAARALKAAIAGGQSFAAAAQAAGFGAADTAIGKQTQAAFAALASPAAAQAAFTLPQGGTTDPVRSPLGWHVVRVDAIETVAARPLAAVRGEIAATLAAQKAEEGFSNLVAAIDDAIAGGSTFDDVLKSEKLTAVTTPPLTATGTAPGTPGWTTPPALQPLLKTGFDAAPDDDPTVESLGAGQPSVVLKLDRVIPAAPVPLAQVRAAVLRDLSRDRAFRRAATVAREIVARADKGMPLAQAIAAAGLNLPAPERAAGRQADVVRANATIPPPLALLFNMAPGKTRVLPAPDRKGWFIVRLDRIERGDARRVPALVQATRAQFSRVLGEEYADQFVRAASAELKVSRDNAAIARVRAQLAGGTAPE